MSMTPILTNGVIEHALHLQRCRMAPPNGWGYSGWFLGANTALATLTPEGWCQIGRIERARCAIASGGMSIRAS